MKKYILILATLALAAVSCDKNESPVFDDADAFVAFDKGAVSVSEIAGTVQIPVTLVSLAGLETTISYEAVDGTAKAGVNFNLAAGAATLTFTKDAPTQIITVNILDPEVVYDTDGTTRLGGKYTGDLKFTLKFKSTGDVNAGRESSCTVTIQDIDHPLSNILGSWTFNALNSSFAATSWANELAKDETDDHKVWFFNLVGLNSGWAGWDISYYGNVSDDLKTITIPLGQESEYKHSGTTPVVLCSVDHAKEYIYDSGNIYATIVYDAAGNVTGLTFDLDQTDAGADAGICAYIPGAGIPGGGWVYGPMTATKD